MNKATVHLDGIIYEFEPQDVRISSYNDHIEFAMKAWSYEYVRQEEPVISKEEALNSFKDQSLNCGQISTTPAFPWEGQKQNVVVAKKDVTLELYASDLYTIASLLNHVEDIANHDGVVDVEVRVKFDEGNWAVLGYGESGDPAVIRFEK